MEPDKKGSAIWDVSKRCSIFKGTRIRHKCGRRCFSATTRVQLKGGKPTAQMISVIIKKNSCVRRCDLFSDATAALDGDDNAVLPSFSSSHPPHARLHILPPPHFCCRPPCRCFRLHHHSFSSIFKQYLVRGKPRENQHHLQRVTETGNGGSGDGRRRQRQGDSLVVLLLLPPSNASASSACTWLETSGSNKQMEQAQICVRNESGCNWNQTKKAARYGTFQSDAVFLREQG